VRVPAFVFAIALTLVTGGIAVAQSMGGEAAALDDAKRQAAQAAARAEALEEQAADADREADRARGEQAAVTARVKAAEADILAARARVAIIERLRAQQRVRLAARQQPIVRLTGALQVMARRPPALAMVQPGTLEDLVHVRALLASSLPLVHARTAGIRAEIAEGNRLRARAALALATLRAGEQQLRTQRIALADLEAEHRRRSERFADSALYEQDRATALGEQARDIVDLMESLDRDADVRNRLVSLPAPLPRPDLPQIASASEPAGPDGGYRLPVAGRLVSGLGEVYDSGVRTGGLTLAVRPGASIAAPAAGRVAFAGPFRSYGQIAIMDHGDGWFSLLTDMAALDVKADDRIDAGETVGVARAGSPRGPPRVSVELRHRGKPVDIVAILGTG
jgi:septal ring factor EnvC (AmiA/AmiB activator)